MSGKSWNRILTIMLGLGCAASLSAADVSGRKMVWAHYVPWLTPDNASQMVGRFYDFPQCDVGEDPYRAEVLRALEQGIDGFFNDMVAHKGGSTSFWDLRPFLKAAEGTPFQFGICLDAKIPVDQQVRELVRMLSTYGNHPNYPKWKDRYVVDTYTFFAWSPDEWRDIRKGCADAGYPIWVIANVETGYTAYSDEKLEPYAGLFDCAYYFSNNGLAWENTKSLERELREAADFCGRHGAVFMPCLWPGYYGGWLNGRCCYYQPFLGFDALLRRYDCALTLKPQWLHVTTWNDHDETTLQTRRLATANPAMIRAMSREFKGQPPAKEAEIQFAYLRETMVGSLLRIEAIRLPSEERTDVQVKGRLLDTDGRPVASLTPRALSGNWQRSEWLVATADLAKSPALVPEFTVTRNGRDHTVRLPAAFLVTTCLKNPETVKVSEKERRMTVGAFELSWKDGILSGTCQLAGEADLKRAVLYRNDLPVTCFLKEKKTILPVFFTGQNAVELSVANGRIVRAVKSFETNGAPNFAWNEQAVVSRLTPAWMRMTARVEADPGTELSLSVSGVKRGFKPSHLLGRDALRVGRGSVRLAPDGTLYDLPPLGPCKGDLHLSVWSAKPEAKDAFWVEFELADGTFAESMVRYPFAESRAPVALDVFESEITLEHTSGASGLPDARPFLTAEAELPVRGTRAVKTDVSPFCIREEHFDFENAPMSRPKLPQRRWPMGTFRLACTLTPLATDGKDHPLLVKSGWNEGPEIALLADGRLSATFCGGGDRGPSEFSYGVKSKTPLPKGKKVLLTLVRDARSFALFLDGTLQQRVEAPPLRVFGNLSPTICGGVNGENPTVALLHDLSFSGDPVRPLKNERLTLNPLFTDHMVFAAGKPMRIFGGGLGKVSVTFRGRTATSVGTGAGWVVELPACDPGGPYDMTIMLDGREIVLKDVCVGEVYLMSGQSNVQFTLARSSVRPADYVDEPRLRCFTVTRPEPGDGLSSSDGWRTCVRAEAGEWSALAYLLGHERVKARNVPVGMVVCAQGASVLRSWLPEAMCAEPRFAIAPKEMHYDFTAPLYSLWNGPGYLYSQMFAKVAPYAFSSVVWYQGESDTGSGGERYYADMLTAMIGRWRQDLRDAALPFTVVQIAGLDARRDEKWRGVQRAQMRMPELCANVRVVRTEDISCTNEIHPPNKLPLARRISASFSAVPCPLGQITSPVVVATPPTFAARDLCVTADGEIRHYGWKVIDGVRHRVFIASHDGANWETRLAAEGDVGAMVKSPYGGDWIYWRRDKDGFAEFVRSSVGPGDVAPKTRRYPWKHQELRQLLAMKTRRRWVAAFSDTRCENGECYHAAVMLSDDDGATWRRIGIAPVPNVAPLAPGDRRPHWFNDGCEPSIVELKDGTLLMAVRTSGPHAAFYRSTDGGESWSAGAPDSSFWQANTMPYFFRLSDGRLLFIWNNTQMLPTRDASEYPELDEATLAGKWESVFTNRDALHAAISEDDGRTWIGFREIILNPIRNADDFRQRGNLPFEEHDKSVHQTQALELSDGKVLLAFGQNVASRRMVVFDPKWLYETSRTEDFCQGVENLSTHLYVRSLTGGWKGFAGHCAWNRVPGALLVRDPETGARTDREVLQLCRIRDPRLVSDRQGVVWNFPAARRGRVTLECRIVGEGFRLALTDHWMNPSDETNPARSPVVFRVTGRELGVGWRRLTCVWDCDAGHSRLIEGNRQVAEMKMSNVPKFGLSYLHLQTLAEGTDGDGALFWSFDMSAESATVRLNASVDATAALQGD